MNPENMSPIAPRRGGRRKSFLSRASSQLSFKSVRSHFSKYSGKRRKSIQDIIVTVDQIKPHVLVAIEDDPQLFHPKDIEKINKSDAFINRFINEHQNRNKNNWEEILKYVLDTLKWRKEFGVNDLKHEMFPKEFYDLQVFTYGYPDNRKNNNNNQVETGKGNESDSNEAVIFGYSRRFRKVDGLQERILQFLIHCIESKWDEIGEDAKLSGFMDISNFSYANVDIKLYLSVIPIFLKHYPDAIQHIYVYELPWMIRPILKFILSLLPAKFSSMVTVVSKSDYKKIVPMNRLPTHMGGTVEEIQFEPANDCITIDDLCNEYELSVNQCKSIMKALDEVKKEIEKEETQRKK